MRLRTVIIAALGSVTAYAQRTVRLDLERTVQLATDSSITADRYRSVFQEARYAWLAWQAGRKPQVELKAKPLQYEQYMVERYVSDTDIDEYRQQKQLVSSADVSAEQIMERWGGSLYASTGIAYLGNYGDAVQHQFATVPIRVGYRQSLIGFNPYRWDRQTEPMRMSIAEQQLSYDVEHTGEEAVGRFFQLALAQEQLRMSREELQSCDTICAIGRRRLRIASISRAELSILEFQQAAARHALRTAQIEHQRAVRELAVWLGMDEDTQLELVVPSVPARLYVSAADAVAKAEQNNPSFLTMQLKELEARRDAYQLKRKKGLSASIDASIGLNQVASKLRDAYRQPLVQNQVVVSLSVPILDHGKNRNAWLAAERKVETAEKQSAETRRVTENEVTQTVAEVNARQAVVEDARHALHIAEDAYMAMLQRFIRGQGDAGDLSLAQSYWQTARRSQVTAIQDFWKSYYHLRTLTLHDFLKDTPIRHHAPAP